MNNHDEDEYIFHGMGMNRLMGLINKSKIAFN